MSRVNDIRNNLKKGDECFLLVTVTPDKPPKRRKAVILEVLRAACRIRVGDDNRERVVRFSELEFKAPATKRKPRKTAPAPVVELRQPMPKLPEPEPEPDPEPEPEEQASVDDLETWFEMGQNMMAPLEDMCNSLRQQDAALEEEAKAIAKERAKVQIEIKKTEKRMARLRAVLDDEDD